MAGKKILEVEALETSYDMIKALKGVSLSASKGKLTCILGPNGAGKSTLLFTLSGIVNSDQGKVLFDGEDITNKKTSDLVEKGLALVPENRLIFPHLTVQENLLAGAYSRLAKEREEVENDISAMYARFPVLKERSKQLGGTMSGGEQQMLAVARALMSKPKLLLMDEPSVGLAPMIVNEIFAIIKQLNAEGISIVLVEQNAAKALEIGDYFYLLDQGKQIFGGSREAILKENIIKKAYLGESTG